MKLISDLIEAQNFIAAGKVIAYPTESVYGLGCDPFNEKAVLKLLQLKNREENKGLILLISTWEQLTDLIAEIPADKLQQVKTSWPGQITWIFPKNPKVSKLVSGDHSTIAIRMSAHPIAKVLCKNIPIISTSANISGSAPAKTIEELEAQFKDQLDAVILGDLGGSTTVSPIYNVLTNERLR